VRPPGTPDIACTAWFGTKTGSVGYYWLHTTGISADHRPRRRMEYRLKPESEKTHLRAEAAFKRKEMQRVEGPKAMAEYNAKRFALREKTVRLRALRLAREAAEASTAETARARS
jgi:hypothetical protein